MAYSIQNSPTALPYVVQAKKRSACWRGFRVVFDFFYKTPPTVLATLVAAVASHLLFPVFTIPLYTITASTFFSKLVSKIAFQVKSKPMEKIELYFWKLKEEMPKLQLIAFFSMLVVSYFVPILGIITATLLGLYNGVTIEIQYHKDNQRVKRQEIAQVSFHEIHQIAQE